MSTQNKKMTILQAIEIAEGAVEAETEEQYIQAWQLLINTGQAWKLQGFFGRVASSMIQQGLCYYPTKKEK